MVLLLRPRSEDRLWPFLRGQERTSLPALHMHRANHQIAGGPPKPQDWRVLKWWENKMRMQKEEDRNAICPDSSLAGKRSEHMQPSTFLFGGACRRPSLKHAGARHNAFAASFAVNRCRSSNKPL